MAVLGKMGMGIRCCHGNGNENDFMGIGGNGNSKSFPHTGRSE